jgi:hypothetical protein
LQRFARATSRKGDGNRGSIDRVREFGDEDNVIVAEGEPCSLNFAAELLNGRSNGFDSVLRVVDDSFPACLRICNLMQEMRHYYLLFWVRA